MFTLPNFCRVCLKYDKNLIDLAHIENEPNETLMSKLELCVAEVEWNTFKPLLCHPCIKRLNIAYSFKKQCVQSSGVLKNYVELVKESQNKNNEYQDNLLINKEEKINNATAAGSGGDTFMVLPNQKFVKIVVGGQNNQNCNTTNSYQNVFLNLIPNTTISAINTLPSSDQIKDKDSNQNVFLNLNSAFSKLIPLSIAPLTAKMGSSNNLVDVDDEKDSSDVNELLTESNPEEMSVEIDPTSFLSIEQDENIFSSDDDEINHDWDELITKQKIDSNSFSKINNGNNNGIIRQTTTTTNYVPILPKDDLYSGGHFLSTPDSEVICESCQKSFLSIGLLKQHLKQFHMGKLPFKCNYCYLEYATRLEFEQCLNKHEQDEDNNIQSTSLTLKDFTENNSVLLTTHHHHHHTNLISDQNLESNDNGEFICVVCKRIFTSASGLLRHRVRKHNQTNRKKYFIKGMKNAKCDICEREFSTQSYMQLHRKLHLRVEDKSLKFKVHGRTKYKMIPKIIHDHDLEDIKKVIDLDSENDEPECKKIKENLSDGETSDSQDENDDSDSHSEEQKLL